MGCLSIRCGPPNTGQQLGGGKIIHLRQSRGNGSLLNLPQGSGGQGSREEAVCPMAVGVEVKASGRTAKERLSQGGSGWPPIF